MSSLLHWFCLVLHPCLIDLQIRRADLVIRLIARVLFQNLRESGQEFNMEKKKAVIVTGAPQGIGEAIVEASCVGPRKLARD